MKEVLRAVVEVENIRQGNSSASYRPFWIFDREETTMNRVYPVEDEAKYGVVGIRIKVVDFPDMG